MQSAAQAKPVESVPALEYPHADAPEPGTLRQVAPGVYWVRMPLPFALNHINLWLLADGAGWTIVDCGYATEAARASWEQIFARHLEGRPVTRVIVTHYHPDHIGLCHWLTEKFGSTVWITRSEYLLAHATFQRAGGTDRASLQVLHERHGLVLAQMLAISMPEDVYRRGVPALPGAFRRIEDGEALMIGGRTWRVIVGHGHAPEHAALYCEALGTLISGDMLLPRISTNVSVWPMEPDGDPLGEFLDSIERFAELPQDTLVLPSHGLPFRGARRRVAELARHHEERLARLAGACEQPRTAAELLPVLFGRTFDDYQLFFAMGEAIAHLNYLTRRGRLARDAGADGLYRFVRRPEHR